MEAVHGSLVRVAGTGVLILGESGAGKSALAHSLVAAGHQLVADDVVEINRADGILTGNAPARFAGLLEVRGLGILDIRKLYDENSYMPSSRIELCIGLFDKLDRDSVEIHGVSLPLITISRTDCRDKRLLVETAVRVMDQPDIKRVPESQGITAG